MEVKSVYKYAKISPLKARDVAREIHGMPVSAALDALNFTPRKAAALVGKTLKSAVANAENNHELSVDTLVVKEATIGTGPTQRRYKPRARGSAGPILRRTSHITIILSDEIPLPEPKQKSSGSKQKKAKAKPAAKKAAPVKEEVEEVEEVQDVVAQDEVAVEAEAVEETAAEETQEAPASEAGEDASAAEEEPGEEKA